MFQFLGVEVVVLGLYLVNTGHICKDTILSPGMSRATPVLAEI